nr:MAG TPA: hypothetical protein [Caudoviricetes sp.]
MCLSVVLFSQSNNHLYNTSNLYTRLLEPLSYSHITTDNHLT